MYLVSILLAFGTLCRNLLSLLHPSTVSGDTLTSNIYACATVRIFTNDYVPTWEKRSTGLYWRMWTDRRRRKRWWNGIKMHTAKENTRQVACRWHNRPHSSQFGVRFASRPRSRASDPANCWLKRSRWSATPPPPPPPSPSLSPTPPLFCLRSRSLSAAVFSSCVRCSPVFS